MDLVGLADLHVALALRLRRPRQLKLEKKETKNDVRSRKAGQGWSKPKGSAAAKLQYVKL